MSATQTARTIGDEYLSMSNLHPQDITETSDRTNTSEANILVLDEEAPTRKVVCGFLARHGYQSLEAGSVAEAAAAIETTHVVAILLEVGQPGDHDGLERLTELRGQPTTASTPAIVMTANLLSEQQQLAIMQQRGYLFYRPEGLSALISFLEQLTGRQQTY